MTDGVADLHHVLGVLGRTPPAVVPPDLGSERRTHVFVVDDIVVKCDDRTGSQSMLRERSALELLAATDLPVARAMAWGAFDDTRQWIVLSRLDGHVPDDTHRLTPEISPGLAAQLGAIVARLHAAARPPGFGTWARGHGRSLVEEESHRIRALRELGSETEIVPESDLDEVVRLMAASVEALRSWNAPVLAHRDVQPRNVLVVDGTVSALLDFESSAGGDPTEDFKAIGLDWTTPGFGAFAGAYAAAGGDLGADAAERLAHHVLNWALVVFAYLGGIVPAYLELARTALARIEAGERPPL